MRRALRAIIVLLAAATPAATQPRTEPALNIVASAFESAFNAKDAVRIAGFYTDDAVVMPPNAQMVKGRQAIETYYRIGFSQSTGTVRIVPLESAITGPTAFESGTSALTAGGRTQTGKYVVIYRRVGNDWKIAYDIFNNDDPPSR
jgi:uncharacterized protein (TIGR02246 family)